MTGGTAGRVEERETMRECVFDNPAHPRFCMKHLAVDHKDHAATLCDAGVRSVLAFVYALPLVDTLADFEEVEVLLAAGDIRRMRELIEGLR